MSAVFIHHGSLLGAWKRARPRCRLRKCRIHTRICWSVKDIGNVCHSFSVVLLLHPCGTMLLARWWSANQEGNYFKGHHLAILLVWLYGSMWCTLARTDFISIHQVSSCRFVDDLVKNRVCGCLTCESADPTCNPMISRFTPCFIFLPFTFLLLPPFPCCSLFPFLLSSCWKTSLSSHASWNLDQSWHAGHFCPTEGLGCSTVIGHWRQFWALACLSLLYFFGCVLGKHNVSTYFRLMHFSRLYLHFLL